MCSNSSNSGGGSSGGDGGGWTMASKKPPKRRKVPKRGPGVAELEKILREREKKDPNTADPYHSQPRPPLHIPPPPPMTVIYANGSSNTILSRGNGGVGGGGGGRGGVCVVGGSSVSLPEQDLFGITLGSCKSNMDRVDGSNSNPGIPLGTHFSNESNDPQYCPSSNLLRRKHFQYPAMMVNHNFPGFATPSLLTTPSSAGKYHHVEPPSNQRSCLNDTSNWPEEEKELDIMRRPKPFSVGYSPGPQFHVQTSSCDNRSAFYFDPTNTISRDTRGGGPLDMINSKKCITACGAAAQNNFYTLGSPTIPSPTTQSLQGEFSKFDLLQMGRKELRLSLNSERGETEGDGIDLNLKL